MMDKGNKVTAGAGASSAVAAALAMVADMAFGIEMTTAEALGFVVIFTALGGMLSDWLTDD